MIVEDEINGTEVLEKPKPEISRGRSGRPIMGGTALMIGGGYLLFRIFGDSYLITLLMIAAWFVLLALTIKFFGNYDRNN